MGQMATDIGGTFTDLVFFDDLTGGLKIAKSLTTPADLTKGLVNTIGQSGVDSGDVDVFVHGGTTVINAITERKGVKTALITTAGFRDVLEIARGNRPDLYNLRFIKERVGADGKVIVPIHLENLDSIAETCAREKVEAVAIMFLHSYVAPTHEALCAAYLAERLPGIPITPSHTITREWREYERANTTVLSAYVQPIIMQYLDRLESQLRDLQYDCPLFAMQSNGGTASFESAKRHPITLIESGPAAGVNGAALISKLCNEPNVIYLDIGGTTAKCSTIQNHEVMITTEYKLEWTRLNFGYPVRCPVVDIVEIGAGGGSIAWFNAAGLLQVGPMSAGGDPGPACYDLGGTEPTVTDAKLLTGVIYPDSFAGGQFRLNTKEAEQAMQKIAARLDCSIEEAAVSVIRMVDANMINALKLVSIQRGHDPREFPLVVGGGGGPMHAAQLARELGVKEVIVPLYPGLFSAWGMLATEQRRDFARSRLSLLRDTSMAEVAEIFTELEEEAVAYFAAERGSSADRLIMSMSCDLRYFGQEHTVTVPVDVNGSSRDNVLADFHDMHGRVNDHVTL